MSVRGVLPGALLACAVGVVACGAGGSSQAGGATQTRAAGQTVAPSSETSNASNAMSRGAAAAAGGDWLRFDYDAQRSGVGPGRTGITPGNLRRLRVRVLRLDGTVDSSPIGLGGIVVRGRRRDLLVVTTTYGRTIALDAGTGTRLWEFTPGDIRSYQGSAQITNATPVADPSRRYVYTATPNGFVHKLRLATGSEVWAARVTYDPTKEKIGPALNIDGSRLLVATGGYDGDAPTYEGHVVSIDLATGRRRAVWNAECSNVHRLLRPPSSCRSDTSFGGSAIWARAGVVVEPGGSRLLVATGNGPFDGRTNWGDSVLELSAGTLRLLHNWTPSNQASLNSGDTDLGSTAPAILPRVSGYRLAVQGGKDGKLHVLNLGRLNGTRGGAGSRLGGQVQDIGSPGGAGVFSAPAVWTHAGRTYAFVADESGTAAYVLSPGRPPRLSQLWSNGNAGTSPVVAGGLLYVYDQHAGTVRVYLPARGHELASLAAASGHWNSPIVLGGRIVVPTGDANDHSTTGELFIWHLPGR